MVVRYCDHVLVLHADEQFQIVAESPSSCDNRVRFRSFSEENSSLILVEEGSQNMHDADQQRIPCRHGIVDAGFTEYKGGDSAGKRECQIVIEAALLAWSETI